MAKYGKKTFQLGSYWLSQRSGSAAWYRTWYDETAKQTRRVTLGTDDFAAAKDKLEEWYLAERMRIAQNLPASDLTLKELFKDYLDNYAVKLRSYRSLVILLRYWEEFYGDAVVSDLRDVRRQEEFRDFLSAKGLAHNSVNRTLEGGRAALNRAYRRNVITSVPHIQCLGVDLQKPMGRPLTVDEIKLLYTHAADHIRLFLILMLGTGGRNEAVASLTWQQIDFENDLIQLNPTGRKQTSKRRPTVKLVPFVREVLEPMDKTTPAIVMFRGRTIAKPIIGVRKAVERAKLSRDVTSYSCRHTVARWLRKEGVAPWETAMQLGHKVGGYSMTERYASWSPEYLDKASVALDKLLRAAIPLDAPPIPSGR